MIRPGGHLIFTLTEISRRECGFGAAIAELVAAGRMRQLERTTPYLVMPYSATEGSLESELNVFEIL